MNRRLFFEMLGTAGIALGLSRTANSQTNQDIEGKLKQLGLDLSLIHI